MTVLSIDDLLLFWERHLKDFGEGTEIEDFLVRSLIVYMCGEYQNEIRYIITQRAGRLGDRDLANFVGSINRTQRIGLRHLRKDVLKEFNCECLLYFDERVKDVKDRYDSIVSNRNSAAHGGVITMTFGELKESHSSAKQLLDALRDALDQ